MDASDIKELLKERDFLLRQVQQSKKLTEEYKIAYVDGFLDSYNMFINHLIKDEYEKRRRG